MWKNRLDGVLRPEVLETKTIFSGFGTLRRDRLRLPNHDLYDYYVYDSLHDAVMVVATTPDGRFLVHREYRHPTDRVLLGFPGGLLKTDEDRLEGARREFREETGFEAENFQLMGTVHPYPGVANQQVHFVSAEKAVKVGEPTLEPSESLETLALTLNDILLHIHEGEPLDGHLCTGLFFHLHLLGR